MNSLFLQTGARAIKPLMLLFSVYLLLSGHNHPGGGFAGGLVAAAGFCLHALAVDVASARKALGMSPQTLIGTGLLVALFSGVIALFAGLPLMTGLWYTLHLPVFDEIKLGTPLIFDVGVYLVVIGITLLIIMNLMEE